MLLKYFFTSARPRRVYQKLSAVNYFIPNSAVDYLRYLRLNNIIAQMKISNT